MLGAGTMYALLNTSRAGDYLQKLREAGWQVEGKQKAQCGHIELTVLQKQVEGDENVKTVPPVAPDGDIGVAFLFKSGK